MAIARPDAGLIQRLGEDLFMDLTHNEADTFAELMENNIKYRTTTELLLRKMKILQ